jgi:hypothetical protein
MTDAARAPGRARRNVVVLNCDAGIFPVAAFLGRRLAGLNPRGDTDVLIVSDSYRDLQTAAALSPGYRLMMFNPAEFASHLPPGFMHAIFHRYFLPAILARDYRRMLYLDVDTYPHDPRLFGIFDLDLSGAAIAAVRDVLIAFPGKAPKIERDTTIRNREGKYLNSGVMLIDIDAYNRARLLDRLCALIDEKRQALIYPDQSALNILLDGDWLELSPAFNMLRAEYRSFVREAFPPVIAHFAGKAKPWHGPRFALDHPVRGELEAFIAGSPWPGFLSRFFGFDQAWQAAGQPPPVDSDFIGRGVIDRAALIHHLRETRFADVAARIVDAHLDKLPE